MLYLSRYYTLYVVMREMRIWPQYTAKCYKNAGKFFPDVTNIIIHILLYLKAELVAFIIII